MNIDQSIHRKPRRRVSYIHTASKESRNIVVSPDLENGWP